MRVSVQRGWSALSSRRSAAVAAAAVHSVKGRRGVATASVGKEQGGKTLSQIKEEEQEWQAKRDFVRLIAEAEMENASNPMVAEAVKTKMYQLHKMDPKTFDAVKVGQIFGVNRARAHAILVLKEMEEELLPLGAKEHGFSGELEEKLEAKFGAFLPTDAAQMELRQERHDFPAFSLVDERINLQKFGWRYQKNKKKGKAPKEQVSENVPDEFREYKESVQLAPADDSRPNRNYRVVCVDTSDRHRDENRPILIEDYDRSIRTADWTERKTLMALYRPTRRKMNKGLGLVDMETMVDLDKFYKIDPVHDTIGLPDYWPNNDRPQPTNVQRVLGRLRAHWKAQDERRAAAEKAAAAEEEEDEEEAEEAEDK